MSALVSLTNARKKFGSTTAFSEVSLRIGQGDIIALAGPNGGGKTTLLRCLIGMTGFDSNRNQLVLGDQAPVTLDTRKRILFLPDDDTLIEDLTAEEYFQFIATTYRTGINKVHEAVEVLESLDFDLLQARRLIKTYSHGMRKKVQLASMVIPDVQLIIVDEPTNGLDPTAIILVSKFIQTMKDSRHGIIISTHNLDFAQKLANRVVLIKNRILYDGPISWLLRDTGTQSLEDAYAHMVLGAREVQ